MKEHIKYAKYVLYYIKGTRELKIKYDGSSDARLISTQTWIGVKTEMIVTPHQDIIS